MILIVCFSNLITKIKEIHYKRNRSLLFKLSAFEHNAFELCVNLALVFSSESSLQ